MAYTVSEIDIIVKNLEASLALGTAEVSFEGRRLVYRTTAAIRESITYFKALYVSATDTPAIAARKVRIYLLHGGSGIGQS